MPQTVHTDFKKLLAQLVNGVGTRPATVYMGLRTNAPAASDTLAASVTEISGAGYARVAITVNSTNFADSISGVDWQLSIPAQSFPTFTGVPSVNNATHWFLTDQASGFSGSGKLYVSAPLNPASVATTLSAAAGAGASTITIPTTAATALTVNDYLLIGTTGNFNANQERAKVTAINSSTGVVTVGVSNAHALGEPVSRDGATRVYILGSTEIVTATIKIVQG